MAHKKLTLPEKPCRQCGRPMVWRKSWAKVWDEVRYCSERCRKDAKANPRREAGDRG